MPGWRTIWQVSFPNISLKLFYDIRIRDRNLFHTFLSRLSDFKANLPFNRATTVTRIANHEDAFV